ncbi:MAG: cytochrome P460 family protein [Proteobacteria bacterium]|nr:cytochrome P460 family protein [Pseudomonadota bacterium]
MPKAFVLFLLLAILLGVVGAIVAVSIGTEEDLFAGVRVPPPVHGDLDQPPRHIWESDSAEPGPLAAEATYRAMLDSLVAGYAGAGETPAAAYSAWRRFNTAPYPSATHGRRLVNNYVNERGAAEYGRFEQARPMPVGTVIAKDSFVVTEEGRSAAGPLFVMEKMADGFNEVSGNWRYNMILPDGALFGVTRGSSAEKVEFCIGCHLAREADDHLYFVPPAFRPGG